MASRKLPGIGLNGGWSLGEAWKAGGDENWLMLSVLSQLIVASATAALPGTPSDGYVAIVPSGTNAKKIAVRDNSVWVYYDPIEGMDAWVKDTNMHMRYRSGAWVEETAGGGGGGGDVSDQINDAITALLEGINMTGPVNFSTPVTVASAGTMSIATADSNIIFISGDEWIGTFGDAPAGIERTLIFTGDPHLAASTAMLTPNGENVDLHANDSVRVVAVAANTWRVVSLTRATKLQQTKRKTTTQASSVTALADITDLSVDLDKLSNYLIDAFIPFTAAAASTGINMAYQGPSGGDSLIEISVPVVYGGAASELTTAFQQETGNVLGTGTSAGLKHVARVRGIVTTFGTAGTFKLRFASSVASSAVTIAVGAILSATKIG